MPAAFIVCLTQAVRSLRGTDAPSDVGTVVARSVLDFGGSLKILRLSKVQYAQLTSIGIDLCRV